MEPDEVEVGGDGCAAPAFYMPLRSFALALARLAKSQGIALTIDAEEADRLELNRRFGSDAAVRFERISSHRLLT
jgi:L-asparaginase II